MSEQRIHGYAAGILRIAKAESEVTRVSEELFRVARAMEESDELRDALTDPKLPTERKSAIVTDLLGATASPLAASVVVMLVAGGRARDLPAIATSLAEQAAAERAKAMAEVRSAVALDEATVRRLEQALGRATGRDVEVRAVVDPTVLGGIVARIGDTVIDGSVRSRLEDLREKLSVEG